MAQTIGKGATITLPALFKDGSGQAVEPTNPTVNIVDETGETVVMDAIPTRDSLGHWHYDYAVPVDANEGAWAAQWFCLINGVPVSDEDGFTVVAAGSIDAGAGGTRGVTCTPWATREDAGPALLAIDGIDLEAVDRAFQIAGDILYELTGRRYPGICSDVIRPQAQYSGASESMPRWWPGAGSWWGWCRCHRGREYGCGSMSEIKLPGHPVERSSVEILLDGEPFDAWELHDGRYLVRTDDLGWPCCQDMTLPTTEEHTFGIAYSFGNVPDLGGVESAVLLGTRLFADWNPGLAAACSPPARATRVSRAGTTIDLADPANMLAEGTTGIRAVDLWVASKRLGAKRRPATVLVPGKHRSARRVNP